MKNPPPSASQSRMRDVAQALGLSTMTVSRALRGDLGVTEATRQKVEDMARNLNYRPNPLVSTLMAQRRSRGLTTPRGNTLAVLHNHRSPEESSSYHFSPGIEERSQELGFGLDHFFLKAPGMSSQRMTAILRARGICGLIIPRLNWGHLSLDWKHFSSVTHGFSLVRPHLTRVASDTLSGMRLALRHLKKAGYQRPGLVLGWYSNRSTQRNWECAYHHGQQSLKKKCSDSTSDFQRHQTRIALADFFSVVGDTPSRLHHPRQLQPHPGSAKKGLSCST
ncbi:MAG: LacI family transcriptional regulator [Blastochloris sp.]|nr:LacI family transcriptional regulator [Blastochloris sp.]